MKKTLYILSGFLIIIILVHFYIKNKVLKNITGEFKSFSLSNIKYGVVPTTDINIKFDIINNSSFSFDINELNVDIYNYKTGEFLTRSKVKASTFVVKGVSNHTVKLTDIEILGNLNALLSGENEYLVKISFNIFLIKIEFEEIIKL